MSQMNNIITLKAGSSDVEIVFDIMSKCSDSLTAQGMSHWQRYDKNAVLQKLKQYEGYILNLNDNPIWFINTHTIPQSFYRDEDKQYWKNTNAEALYFSSICINPQFQNNWYWTYLINFVINKARDKWIKFVRMSFVNKNKKLAHLYGSIWFQTVQTRYVEDVDWDVSFCELCL